MITYKNLIKILLPIVFLSVLMNLSRFFLTEVHSYLYMNWNLFLAILPLIFVFLFEKNKNRYFRFFIFFIWLFFLPNSIYMVTDFIHLRNVGPDWLLWFDGMMIFSYSLVGLFIFSYSFIKMKKIIFNKKVLKYKKDFFLISISILSAFGVYLGRYIRFNTWDIFIKPKNIIENIVVTLNGDNINIFITTIIFFTLFSILNIKSLGRLFNR